MCVCERERVYESENVSVCEKVYAKDCVCKRECVRDGVCV